MVGRGLGVCIGAGLGVCTGAVLDFWSSWTEARILEVEGVTGVGAGFDVGIGGICLVAIGGAGLLIGFATGVFVEIVGFGTAFEGIIGATALFEVAFAIRGSAGAEGMVLGAVLSSGDTGDAFGFCVVATGTTGSIDGFTADMGFSIGECAGLGGRIVVGATGLGIVFAGFGGLGAAFTTDSSTTGAGFGVAFFSAVILGDGFFAAGTETGFAAAFTALGFAAAFFTGLGAAGISAETTSAMTFLGLPLFLTTTSASADMVVGGGGGGEFCSGCSIEKYFATRFPRFRG